MRILISTTHVPFVTGGAELHAENLKRELIRHGHEAEVAYIPFKWYPPAKVLDHLLACRLMDLSESAGTAIDRVIGLKFPAYHVPHSNKVIWILHQFRGAFDLWQTEKCDMGLFPDGRRVRDALHEVERKLLPEARALFANSANVSRRLADHCELQAEPLYHPPPGAEELYTGKDSGYFFYPSRLCEMKRQHLVLDALSKTSQPVKVRFAGMPEVAEFEERLRQRADRLGVADRVTWLGRISEDEKRRQYAEATGVVYTPIDEDYGYVTLEAMLSSKPVVVCLDSGGPLEFVRDGETGRAVEPSPEAIAEAMDEIWLRRAEAREMGVRGREVYLSLNITWDNVVEQLLK